MWTDDEDWEIITSGNTLVNWQADTFIEQYNNGRFVIRRGFPDRKETILFDSKVDKQKDDYFTKMRGNGDLITFRGTPDDPKGDSVWKLDNDSPEGQYFLGVECDLGTVSIYEFVPEDPGTRLWTTSGTDWVPDDATMPPLSTPSPTGSPIMTTAEPEITFEPESTTVEPNTGSVEPETTNASPETTNALPETTTVESETTIADPETTVEVATTTAQPETTIAEPETTTMETPGPSSSPTSNIAPGVVAVSGSFCTSDDPCPICYGDCDVSTEYCVSLP